MWPWRRRRENELTEEIELHIRLDAEERIDRGESPSEAAASARREFGNRMLVAEAVRRQWRWARLGSFFMDLRFALRNLRRNRAFAATAIATLAAGIAAATVMFSVLYGVLIDPFPYKDANRLVLISVFDRRNPGEPGRRRVLSADEGRAYASLTGIFEGLVSSEPRREALAWHGFDRPTLVVAVSGNTFEFLGIPARIGRPLIPSDAAQGAPPVAVISEGAWKRLYGGDPAILGRTISLDRKVRTIVGVIPKRYAWFNGEFWFPLASDPDANSNTVSDYVQGRLKPGVSIALANAELTRIGQRMKERHPDRYPRSFEVRGIYCVDDLVGGAFRRTLFTVSGAVLLLLLIACSNVASLLLSRSTARSSEIGMRIALGAARSRIVRQLLVESGVLALSSCAVGCLLALAGLRALTSVLPTGAFANESVVALNAPVLVFALVLSLFTVLLFGLAPAWQLARSGGFDSLRGSGKEPGDQGRALWLSEAFVAIQIALALVLTLGAALFLRTFLDMMQSNLHVDPRSIVVAFPGPSPLVPFDPRRMGPKLDEYQDRLRRLPGVAAVGRTSVLPATIAFGGPQIQIETPQGQRTINGLVSLDTDGVAGVMGYRLLAGRWIQASDCRNERRIAVVNESLAHVWSPGRAIVGGSLRLPSMSGSMIEYQIVGVVEDVSNNGLSRPVAPMVHIPLGPSGFGWLMVRTTGNPQTLLDELPVALAAVDRSLVVSVSGTLDEQLETELGPQRFAFSILTLFAALGLGLVMVGLYGAMSHTVARRTYELGVRKALGAKPTEIIRCVSARALRAAAFGAVAGTIASVFASRLIANQLGRNSPYDLHAWLIVMAVILFAAFAGMAAPAARAVLLDPAKSLRHD